MTREEQIEAEALKQDGLLYEFHSFIAGAQWADQNKKYPETYEELVRVEAKLTIAMEGLEHALAHQKTLLSGNIRPTTQVILENALEKISSLRSDKKGTNCK